MDQRALMADWFDHWTKGAPLRLISADPVRIFRMGGGTDETKPGKLSHGGTWLNASVWPLPAQQTTYFMQQDGELATAPAAKAGSRTLLYDPRHPAPTIGGRYGMGGWSPNCAQDQVCSRGYLACENDLPLNQRADVLSFASQPLQAAVEVTGSVRAKLWVSSDAADTDLVVKLVDVYPDGYAMLLSVGQLRLRYRNGYSRVALMKPGERYQVDVELDLPAICSPPGTASVWTSPAATILVWSRIQIQEPRAGRQRFPWWRGTPSISQQRRLRELNCR